MKKTKVYRPRRGMRFTTGRRGADPSAGFVAGPAITRTRPTQGKVNLALKRVDSAVFSGSVMQSVRSIDVPYTNPTTPTALTSSIYIEAAISTGRMYERKKLNATLLGLSRTAVDKAPWPSTAIIDAGITPGLLTGSFEIPSWVGRERGFVITPISSSHEEVTSLNYFNSGTQAVENSAVPASASLFYSKKQTYQTITVKKTASIFDTAVGLGVNNTRIGVPRDFYPGTGSLFSVITGSFGKISGGLDAPAVIRIHVPVNGKLIDIRVWVEIVHLSGGVGRNYPLGNLGVALRSPNLHWGNAHPIRNDPALLLVDKATTNNDTGRYDPDVNRGETAAGFHRDTFILWEGAGLFGTLDMRGPVTSDFNGGSETSRYPTWQKDRGMRTIFSDSSQIPNPRHLYSQISPSGNYVGSPAEGVNIHTPYGADVPWTTDKTIFPATESYQAVGSPPPGWLNGPASTALENEWPTTGSNIGALTLRPMYPLLDPIYTRKVLGSENQLYATGISDQAFATVDLVQSFRGFRPGLRGSEISGTWELVLAQQNNGLTANTTEVFFRQARLEITYAQGTDPVAVRARPSAARRMGELVLVSISGSDQNTIVGGYYDWYVSKICTSVGGQSEIGRTFGLVMNTGSVSQQRDFAVLFRLTGTLADLSGSAPPWLTNNFTCTPSIPVSSASLVLAERIIPPSSPPGHFIFPQKSLDGARRLENVAADFNPPAKLTAIAVTFVSSSATS